MTYTKRRDRIVKSRTAKQRAHANKITQFRAVTDLKEANPTRSWWLGLDRAELQAAAAVEQKRITWSRCGRVSDPKYAHNN